MNMVKKAYVQKLARQIVADRQIEKAAEQVSIACVECGVDPRAIGNAMTKTAVNTAVLKALGMTGAGAGIGAGASALSGGDPLKGALYGAGGGLAGYGALRGGHAISGKIREALAERVAQRVGVLKNISGQAKAKGVLPLELGSKAMAARGAAGEGLAAAKGMDKRVAGIQDVLGAMVS